MRFELDDSYEKGAKMKVMGIGGAGGNAVNGMINADLTGVEFVAINTDMQALDFNKAPVSLRSNHKTRGIGNLELYISARLAPFPPAISPAIPKIIFFMVINLIF